MAPKGKNKSGGGSNESSVTTTKPTTTATTLKKKDSNSNIGNNNAITTSAGNTDESNNNNDDDSSFLYNAVWVGVMLYGIYQSAKMAYKIRLQAIEEYGTIIHEFDPYFNYRATEYLYWNGAKRFFQWFDKMVWYPLGRPVGTTIYPGMQFTAVYIKNYILPNMSLNDICCYIPAWFGVLTTLFTGMIAYECSLSCNTKSTLFHFLKDIITGKKSSNYNNGIKTESTTNNNNTKKILESPAAECGVVAAFLMSIVPAHLMRSVGGGYDNESIAMTAMVLTFYFWVRSLRNHPILFGICTGLAYFYMVAAWGGYVFVLNLIGVHAAVLVVLGRFSKHVYTSYTIFYILGTVLAIQVPVVGWAPLKSLEQLGPCIVFCIYQILFYTEQYVQKDNLSRKNAWKLRVQIFGIAAAIAFTAIFLLAPKGYFGPISARVRGLFVKHTKTGNPLVDSVAEHQPASNRAYFQYLHHVCSVAPLGYLLVFFKLSDASSFLLVWGSAAYFFSHKMVRLILLTAPIGCILGGIAVARALTWSLEQWWDQKQQSTSTNNNAGASTNGSKKKSGGGGKKSSANKSSFEGFGALKDMWNKFMKSSEGILTKRTVAAILVILFYLLGTSFVSYCWRLSADLSHPTIVQKGRMRDGRVVTVDDYRDAYFWLRDNTPKDARVLSWWDYGYQISAIANRTTIADGNTWNHEHIALLGKALTTDLKEGWEIARHLADYVLIWGGGGGDDLAKSPHLARIANSVYRDHCPDDPTCRAFGFVDSRGTPSAMMRRSFLYNLHGHGIRPDVDVPKDMFEEVYTTKFGKVRIFKIIGVSEESKLWVQNNYKCDVPGGWYCPGQYPPGLKHILDRKKDFRQLEDFNRQGDEDDEYQRRYFQDLQNPEGIRQKMIEKEYEEMKKRREEGMTDSQLDDFNALKERLYRTWEDSEASTRMWQLIMDDDVEEIEAWLQREPQVAFVRSKDGRGPMFWAFEQRNEAVTKLLMKAGVPHTDSDASGITPVDLLSL